MGWSMSRANGPVAASTRYGSAGCVPSEQTRPSLATPSKVASWVITPRAKACRLVSSSSEALERTISSRLRRLASMAHSCS